VLKNIYSSSFNLKDIDKIANQLILGSQQMRLWLFYGDLGSGKTTLIKALCKSLKVKSNIASATYSIINEYIDKDANTIYHCDFYRINDYKEAIELGAEDIFYGNAYCFVEWPSKIQEILPQNNFSIYMSYESEYSRGINVISNNY
jgi:tRNA threonylcarbamoyladenosine biosynthesis protein TsaE